MEQDVNIIIDVESEEAQLLIALIETLFKEWYINRHEEDERMKALVDLAQEKEAQRKQPPPPSSEQ